IEFAPSYMSEIKPAQIVKQKCSYQRVISNNQQACFISWKSIHFRLQSDHLSTCLTGWRNCTSRRVYNMSHAYLAAFAIGIIAGLRSITAPATASWAAHLNWINLQNSRLSFLSSTASVIVLTVLAIAELVNDKLPKTPNRTSAVPFGARIVTGAFSGVAL